MIITSHAFTMSAPTNSLAAGYVHPVRRAKAKIVRTGSVDTCTSYEVLFPGQAMSPTPIYPKRPPTIINTDDSMNVDELKSGINSIAIPSARRQSREFSGSPEVILSFAGDCRSRRSSCNDLSNKPPMSPSPRSAARSPSSAPGRRRPTRQDEVTQAFSSCPDLTRSAAEQRRRQRLRKNKSTDGRLQRPRQTPEPSPPGSARESPKLLTVPNFFTTSYTHSSSSAGSSRSPSPQHHIDDMPIPKAAKILGIGYRHSEPDLAAGANFIVREGTLMRQSSQKSTSSDVRPVRRESIPEDPEDTSPDIWKVAKYVYVGNIQALHCQSVLCRWKIQKAVDLTGSDSQSIPKTVDGERCDCGLEQTHNPAMLRVKLNEYNHREAKSDFLEINKFVKCAREQHRNTLICCQDGSSLRVAVAMQYFMHEHDYDFRKAHSRMLKVNPNIELTSAQRKLLQSVDIHAEDFDSEASGHDINNEPESRRDSTGSLPAAPKQAWGHF